MHASYYSASLLACWMRFILLPSHTNRQKTLTFTCQFQTGEEDKGEQMSGAVGEKSCYVIAGGCHHYASGALNCCTGRRNRMNILTQTNGGRGGRKRPAKNWTGVARPSNIRMRMNVGLIRTGALNSVWTKTRAFGLPDETYHATQPGFSEAHYKQSSGVFKTRARSINR